MTTRILTLTRSTLALALFAVSASFVVPAHSSELDNEALVINEQAVRAKDLPQTVVVRINDETGAASVLESKTALPTDISGVEKMASQFKSVSASGVAELDRNGATSSWYAWYNYGYYYAPVYHYYNYTYTYTNYYSYRSYGYSYYWYRWY